VDVVTLEGVSYHYTGAPEQVVLRDCDLRVARGDFVTLVGPSGSGKSTLLNIVGLLDRPVSGRYLLDGDDMTTVSEKQRTRVRGNKIGFVFQAFQLLEERTCLENVMMSDLYRGYGRAQSQESAALQLERVGLASLSTRLPTALSGGQRQRVAIARALAAHPSLLLCDEPTGNLDSESTASVLELFGELNRKGVTILLITHDPGVAEAGNRQVSILDGALSETSRGLVK
jgi:putative ABC transport system ATP-binding protein